jgi:hypothetical protein
MRAAAPVTAAIEKLGWPATLPEVRDEVFKTCHVVDAGCTAPAGMLGSGGAILDGLEPADFECRTCGEWTCENCADETQRCNICIEDYGDDDDDDINN